MRTLSRIAFILICFCSVSLVLHAQVPQLINYQGRVVVGTTNFDGSGQFKFALVNTAGTTTYWSNDATSTSGSEPTNAVTLTVTKGLYSVGLGDNSLTNMTALPGSVFTNSDVRLRVWFNDGTHGSQLLTPDQRIATAGYAFMADNIKDGAITSTKLANGAVGTTQLASGAVGSANIASGAVGGGQLAPGLTLAGTTTGTFSGPLTGNASTAGSATNFTGSLAGDITGTQGATSIAAATVTGKALTGFSSTTGTITASDTVLSAINKLNGNDALKAPLASPSFTGTVSVPAVNLPATTSATNGVIEMAGTPILSAKGTQNLFLGNGAGNFTLTGTQNTATGASSFVNNTSGTGNTAAGVSSLAANTTGFNNTATGFQALGSNTTASNNVATGQAALLANTTGGNNTATGTSSLRNNNGSSNTAIGTSALTNNTSGANNIGIGINAGQTITTGSNNIDIGSDAAAAAESNTIRIGTTGTQTAAFIAGVITGDGSGLTNLSASNVSSGTVANSRTTGTNNNTASTLVLRDASGNFSAGTITASLAGNASTATSATTAGSATNFSGSLVGDVTGTQGATAIAATSVTGKALTNFSSTTGTITASDSVLSAIDKLYGNDALKAPLASPTFTGGITLSSGVINIPATSSATNGVIQMAGTPIISAPGTKNVFLGNGAGNFTLSGTGQNTGVGYQAMQSVTTGFQNTATGYQALSSNTAGQRNTVMGAQAASLTTTGVDNTAIGFFALANNTDGSDSTALGDGALNNVVGTNNIGIGFGAGQFLNAGSNNIYLGTPGGLQTESNTIRIGTTSGGNSHTAAFIAGISGATLSPSGTAVFINSNGQLGTINSSRRFKTDIKPMDDASDVLLSLRPVTFRYKPEIDAKGIPQFGLIAEEVAEVCPDLVIHDNKGEIQTVRYEQVNAMLLNEFLKQHGHIADLDKEQQTQLAALRNENTKLRAENAANAKRLAALETRDKEREARLTRLEIATPGARPVSNSIVDNNAANEK
ncbi:MAG: hypothetical protein QOH39_1873 [Verrucomicrobiota bacterium]